MTTFELDIFYIKGKMFESDDFDQILSQFEIPDLPIKSQPTEITASICNRNETIMTNDKSLHKLTSSQKDLENRNTDIQLSSTKTNNNVILKSNLLSPKLTKRKIINTHFDHNSKRKFPGPAGLLTGTLDSNKDDTICHMELLSQDIDFSQSNLRRDLFDSPLWNRLIEDIKKWNLDDIDSIKLIKQQALTGNLNRRKAQTVIAFVETVDRSATDPLIILRDTTGNIKCTLHRDAWSSFSQYIVSEYCAFVLRRPTVLTTGSAFKKHYLNITLNNIFAIYSSAVIIEIEKKALPDGYTRLYEDDFTIIKSKVCPQELGINLASGNVSANDENDLLEGLDNIFSDEIF